MEAIAARAGISKVTLYKRYSDKRKLLQAVLQEQRPRWIPSESRSADIEVRLKHLSAAILTRAITPEVRAFDSLVASAWPALEEMPLREEVLGYRDMTDRLAREIRENSEKLGIRHADELQVAIALMSMLSGWFDHREVNSKDEHAEATRFAHYAVELIIYGKAAW